MRSNTYENVYMGVNIAGSTAIYVGSLIKFINVLSILIDSESYKNVGAYTLE